MKEMLSSYADKLKDSLYWWLSPKRPFIVNDQYKIELLHIDREHQSVKIRITNLSNNQSTSQEFSNE